MLRQIGGQHLAQGTANPHPLTVCVHHDRTQTKCGRRGKAVDLAIGAVDFEKADQIAALLDRIGVHIGRGTVKVLLNGARKRDLIGVHGNMRHAGQVVGGEGEDCSHCIRQVGAGVNRPFGEAMPRVR